MWKCDATFYEMWLCWCVVGYCWLVLRYDFNHWWAWACIWMEMNTNGTKAYVWFECANKLAFYSGSLCASWFWISTQFTFQLDFQILWLLLVFYEWFSSIEMVSKNRFYLNIWVTIKSIVMLAGISPEKTNSLKGIRMFRDMSISRWQKK